MIFENILWLLYLKFTLANNFHFKELALNTSISRATVQIVNDFYVKQSSTIVITTSTINFENQLRQSELINEIIQGSSSEISVMLQNDSHISTTHSQINNLIFIDSYESFSSIFAKMTANAFDFTGFYTIILTESYRDQYAIITRILQDCWTIYITNVIVLVTVEIKTRTAIYTYFPYTLYHCEVVAPVILNYYIQNSYLYEPNFFPPKLRNMYKCPLNVATSEEIPYMFLIPQKNGSIYTDGIDGIIFRVLSQRLNFTPALIIPNQEEILRDTPANGSSISVWMKLVYSGKANLTISGFAYTKERADLLTASFPYFFSSLLFTVPNGRSYSAFEKLFLPFKYIIWSCIATMFVIAVVLIFGMKFLSTKSKMHFLVGRNNPTPLLNMANIFFGGSLDRLPARNFARFIFCIWILGCTVLRSAYQGALFDFIQKTKTVPPMKTVPELVQHDYTLYMSSLSFGMFKLSPLAQKKVRIHNLTLEEKFLNLMNTNFKGAFLTTEAAISYYNMKHMTTNKIVVRPTLDRVFLMPMCIYFRKHSCLTNVFNEQINLYTSSGLMVNWVSQFYQAKYLRVRVSPNERSHRKLEQSNLNGTYILCFYMIILTVIVFCLEFMSEKIPFLRKFLEIFN